MQSGNSLINDYPNNMVMITAAIGTSVGKREEDVGKWVKNTEMTAHITGLNTDTLLPVVLLATGDETQTWALKAARRNPERSWSEFKEEAVERFAAHSRTLEAMTKLFTMEQCKGKAEYPSLLNAAEILAESGAVEMVLLLRSVVAAASVEVRGILNGEAHGAKDRFEFKQGAECATWFAFSYRGSQRE